MNPSESLVMQVLAAYQAAVYEKDVDAFMRLYAADVRVFDAWDTWSYDGAVAWRGMIEQWFSAHPAERVRVDMDEVRITAGTTLATASAFVTYTGVSATGEALRAMHNRLSWALRLEDGAWRIFHEHTSAPIGYRDSKAILLRPPA
jgi:uncharacterized protein (TIGR02246 family)